MRPDPKALYHPLILRHSKSPTNYHKNDFASHHLDAYNPLCGDHFHLYFDLIDGRIQGISFYGHGCSVSKASTSVLVEKLEGKTLEEAEILVKSFLAMIQEEGSIEQADFEPFAAAKNFPGRQQCATLAWESWLKGDIS